MSITAKALFTTIARQRERVQESIDYLDGAVRTSLSHESGKGYADIDGVDVELVDELLLDALSSLQDAERVLAEIMGER